MRDTRSRELAWLAGILVVGLALRLYRLGALGFAANEDYLAIAVRSILADGIPDFPSGLHYVRALPLSYLTSGLAALFGSSEVVLRIPSVLFSMLSIVGVYLLGRRLTSPRVALLAALLMAVSDWQVDVGRTARMYAMLSASCLMSVGLLREALERRSRWLGVAAVGFGALASMTHQIGGVLVLMVLCCFLYRKPDRWQARLLVCCIAVVSVGFIANKLIVDSQYNQWTTVVQAVRAEVGAERPFEEPVSARGAFTGKYLSPFLTLRASHRGAFLAMTVLAGGILLALGWAVVRRSRDRLFPLMSAPVVVALYFQQLMVAAMLLVTYAAIGRVREPGGVRSRVLQLGLVFTVTSVCWVLFWLAAGSGLPTAGGAGLVEAAKDLLKPLIGYPPPFLRIVLEHNPLMSALAVVACGVAAARFWRDGRVDGLGLVALLFVVPAVGLSFHPAAMERSAERYIFFADAFFLLVVAFGALWIGERLWALLAGRRSLRLAIVGLYSLGVLVMSDFANARASLELVTAEYGVYGRERSFHPDLAGSAQFVRDHYQPTDVVIAMDILGYYAYSPVAHYQLSLFGKPDAEAWLGAHSLASAGELSEALERHREQRVWIVMAATHIRRLERDPEMRAILRVIVTRAGEPLYRGRDGLSDVYRVEPRESR